MSAELDHESPSQSE